MKMLTVIVHGRPRQKGSANAFVVPRKGVAAAIERGATPTRQDFRAVVTSDNPNAKYYEQEIRAEVTQAMTGPLWTGPIAVDAVFVMPRPQRLKAKFEPYLVAPDTDKMLRCVLDALTHVVYADDKQVVRPTGWKRYANQGEQPHTLLRVSELTAEQLVALEQAERDLRAGLGTPVATGTLF